MKKILILLLSLFAFSIQSCYYDNEEELYPQITDGCDTTNVTYSNNVQKIISSRCLGCHSDASYKDYGGGVALEGYNNLKSSADNGGLIGTITHNQDYSAMPKGANKLDDCKIEQIKTWVAQGAKNN